MEFKQAVLDNGLTVIGEIMGSARSLAMGFFVRTGARDETAEVAGVSHFLEHMMFKGTSRRTALQVNLEFDHMGAKYNAFTSEENTVYYASVLPEYQNRVLELWADLMRPALREEDFQMEKGVICEEIAMYKDMPQFDVLDRCRHLHYGEHPCGNSVLGTVESVQGLSSQAMGAYFQRRYAPDNMVLVGVGQLDWDGLVDQAVRHCQSWKPSGPRREYEDFSGTGRQEYLSREHVQREHVCMMCHGPSAGQESRFAAALLASVIGDDTGSRFYWNLVDTALADTADMEYDAADGTGAFYIYLSCDTDKRQQVIDIVNETLDTVRREGVTEKELQAGKNKIASAMTLGGELPMGRLVPLGFNWVYRQEYRSLEKDLDRLGQVTVGEINTLLEEYPLERRTLFGLGPAVQA